MSNVVILAPLYAIPIGIYSFRICLVPKRFKEKCKGKKYKVKVERKKM